MRNRYTKEFEDFVRNNISKYKREEFRLLLQKKYNISLSTDALRRYLTEHNIQARYIDYQKNQVRYSRRIPVGTERVSTGITYIKTDQPNVWRRKSRVMYEKYHNCKLNDDEYILFLNQDRNDFSKENLIKSSNKEMAYLHNWGTYSKNPELTKAGILSARLMIKMKQKLTNNIEQSKIMERE